MFCRMAMLPFGSHQAPLYIVWRQTFASLNSRLESNDEAEKAQKATRVSDVYRGTSLIRNCPLLGP